MAAPERQEQVIETPREKWLRERRERVKEAQRRGKEAFNSAVFIGIRFAGGPGGMGSSNSDVYMDNDGHCFFVWGREDDFVYQDDPEELQIQVKPGGGKYRVGGSRETLGGFAIRTIDLGELMKHQYPWEGIFTPLDAFMNGHDYTKPFVNNHTGTSKRSR